MAYLSRHIAPLLMALLVLVQALDKGLIWSSFHLNQSYIAKNLCENRNIPQRHCDGKCLLSKVLKKTEDKETQQPKARENVVWLLCEHLSQLLPEQSTHHLILSYRYPKNESLYDSMFFDKRIKPPSPYFFG